jgi:hypothetical protein
MEPCEPAGLRVFWFVMFDPCSFVVLESTEGGGAECYFMTRSQVTSLLGPQFPHLYLQVWLDILKGWCGVCSLKGPLIFVRTFPRAGDSLCDWPSRRKG